MVNPDSTRSAFVNGLNESWWIRWFPFGPAPSVSNSKNIDTEAFLLKKYTVKYTYYAFPN
jgi:hypothetical protein